MGKLAHFAGDDFEHASDLYGDRGVLPGEEFRFLEPRSWCVLLLIGR